MVGTVKDNELAKFRTAVDNSVSVAVTSTGDMSGLLSGILYDTVTVTYPTTTSEIYVYSLLAVNKATVTLVYTDTTKNFLSTAVRS